MTILQNKFEQASNQTRKWLVMKQIVTHSSIVLKGMHVLPGRSLAPRIHRSVRLLIIFLP